MDFENFDEGVFTPEQTSLSRYLKGFGVALAATFLLPIGRSGDSPINVWDQFGMASTWPIVQLVLPAVVGLGFIYLGFLSRHPLRIRAAATTGLLLLMLVVGINVFAVLNVVVPPITGGRAEAMFGMVDGNYFPREDTLHLVLLGAGLIGLGIGGRYRNLLQTSRLGSYILMGAAVVLVGYYTVPYDSEVPAVRNVELYHDFHEFAGAAAARLDALELELAETAPELMEDPAFRERLQSSKMVGQIKLSAVYFAVIYFVPLLLLLASIPAWMRSRYLGHRAVFAKLSGWGASIYLLAFLFPLLVKESMRKTGPGFLPALRDYIIFAAVMVGLTLAASSLLKEVLEPKRDDEALPADPLAWRESA